MEADLHRHYNCCKKNPGHTTFIPSDRFNCEDLPARYHDTELLAGCIRSELDLTVRVTVKCVSDRRPSTVPGTDRPYPSFGVRGQQRTTVGTGWIHSVYKFLEKCNSQFKTCPCKECHLSSEPEKQFAFIRIHTAAHVVFDDIEGERATCHLFFNRGGTPDSCRGVVTLTGMWRVFSDVITDHCSMIHMTHDMGLAADLERMAGYRDNLKESYVIKSLLHCPMEETERQDALVCLVSHPHGCSSHISVGVAVRTKVREPGRVIYLYDTAACPGSSGSRVFTIWKDLRLWGFEHTHSRGRCEELTQINHSSHGVGYRSLIRSQAEDTNTGASPSNSQVEQENRGQGEVQECLPETDLHSCYIKCTKNPGHHNFIPIDEFSEDHLPPGRRHLVEHIKVLANIVALVGVTKVSSERPETFPDTDIKFPRSPQRGSSWIYKVLRFGNINGVRMGKCTCEECQKSNNPKESFAHIIIHTAAHVVFDDFEGKYTTCYLFYDKGKTVEACGGVVKLTGMSRVWSDAEKDVCKMLYVTHDPVVIDRVEKVVNEWESARRSLELKNKITSLQDSSLTDASRQALAIAVSHPHGCSKQVSIGHCVSVDDKGIGQTVYKYTTPTCNGCSGAYVYVEGRDWQSWDDNMHIGVHDYCGLNYSSGLNYSG